MISNDYFFSWKQQRTSRLTGPCIAQHPEKDDDNDVNYRAKYHHNVTATIENFICLLYYC